MLDADLAEIYGYDTKGFNRQVKNNIEKFNAGNYELSIECHIKINGKERLVRNVA